MICNRCGLQLYDGANFCANCGVQFNPNVYRQYQAPPNFPMGNSPEAEAENSQKSIFMLGFISFAVSMFWIFITLVQRFLGLGIFGRSGIIIRLLSVVTSVLILFLCFLWVKKQNHKNILLILLIVSVLIQLLNLFGLGYFGRIF